jgi:hypothetical protein
MTGRTGKGRLGAAVGTEMVGPGWRIFFALAAVYNLAIGTLGMATPEATTDARVIGLLVFCFGIVYVFVARDPVRFAPALWAGVVGKFGVVALLAPAAMAPGGDPVLAGILTGDALFALGFLAFLLTRRASR